MIQTTRRKRIVPVVGRWFILVLIGWLAYGLARALGILIHLGAPFFDWQWYLCLLILLVILSVRVVWRWPRSVLVVIVSVALLIWVVAGCFGWGRTVRVYPARAAPIPISYWTGTGIVEVPETILEDIRSAGGALYMVVGARSFDGEEGQALIAGLRRLAEHEIEVYLAVYAASDYLTVPAHGEWTDSVKQVATVAQKENLANVRGIIGDAENPKRAPLDILGLDRDAFFQAVYNLDGLIQWVKSEHPDLSIGVTALWTLYLDHTDGDADLSIIHRSSVDPPGNWDFINVMVYSSYFPPSWRAYYIYIAEQVMARLYPGIRPSCLIGLTAPGQVGEPTLEFDDLVRDARLSRAVGAPEIVVFILNDVMFEKYGADCIRRLTVAVNEVQPEVVVEIPFSRPASMLIYGTLCADALLDVRGWRGLWILGWVIVSGGITLAKHAPGVTIRKRGHDNGIS